MSSVSCSLSILHLFLTARDAAISTNALMLLLVRRSKGTTSQSSALSAHRNPQRNGALGGRPGAGGVIVPQRLQGRLEEPAPLPGLLRPRDMAEELRQKEERQEAERARAKAKEAEEKKKAEVSALSPALPLMVNGYFFGRLALGDSVWWRS